VDHPVTLDARPLRETVRNDAYGEMRLAGIGGALHRRMMGVFVRLIYDCELSWQKCRDQFFPHLRF
jgi:hypothetical protein